MDANDIRRTVINVNPPKPGEMSKVAEVNKEIAALCPFWTPLLKNRDLRDMEGGDQYIQGLIETFARIYSALKAEGKEGALSAITADDLFAVDEAMSSNDLNLSAEYPVLSMLDISKLGAFGAGIFAAYGLFEMSLLPPKTANGKKEVAKAATPTPEDFGETMESLLDEAEAPAPKGPVAVGSASGFAKGRQKIAGELKFQPMPAGGENIPVVSFSIYELPGGRGFKVVGDLAPTLAAAARAHTIVKAYFGVDANLVKTGTEDLQFSFSVLEK